MATVTESRLWPFKESPECFSAWSTSNSFPQTSEEFWVPAVTLSCQGNYAACALCHTRPIAGVAICMHACSPFAFWMASGRSDGRACNGLELWCLVGFKAQWCSCSLLGFSLPTFRERYAYGLSVLQLTAALLPVLFQRWCFFWYLSMMPGL